MLSENEKTQIVDAYFNAEEHRELSANSTDHLSLTILEIYDQGQKKRPPTSTKEIGDLLGLSRQRVGQIIKRGREIVRKREAEEIARDIQMKHGA